MRKITSKSVTEYVGRSGMRIRVSVDTQTREVKYLQIVGGTGQILTLTEAQAEELREFYMEDLDV